MIKKLSKMVMHRFMMYPSNNELIRKHFDNNIISMCNNIAFGENVFDYIKKNVIKNTRTYILLLSVFTILSSFYLLGYRSAKDVINYMTYNEQILNSRLLHSYNMTSIEKVKKVKYKNMYSNIADDSTFIKYIVFRETGILIPNGFDLTHLRMMIREADNNEIPYNIMFRLVKKECQYICGLVSPKGARGYMQVMPETRKYYRKILKLGNMPMVEENIVIGTRLLRDLYILYSKKHNPENAWRLALAAYNSGIGNVEKYNGIPPFNETKSYVAYILSAGVK